MSHAIATTLTSGQWLGKTIGVKIEKNDPKPLDGSDSVPYLVIDKTFATEALVYREGDARYLNTPTTAAALMTRMLGFSSAFFCIMNNGSKNPWTEIRAIHSPFAARGLS